MRIMRNKNLVKAILHVKDKGRISLLLIMLTMILTCAAACSSKEAILLEDDNLVFSGDSTKETDNAGNSKAEDGTWEETPTGIQGNAQTGILENAQTGIQENAQTATQKTQSATPVQTQTFQTDAIQQQVESSTLFVHICGEVVNPGVYELPAGSRIFEAVEEAGGFTLEAEKSYVNLAQQLEDGYKIRIPAIGEEPEAECEQYPGVQKGQPAILQPSQTGSDSGLVDINRADKIELCTLPGVGESRAESIISYREKNGGFSRIEDIMKVEGIKEGMFAKMKDKICVRGVE